MRHKAFMNDNKTKGKTYFERATTEDKDGDDLSLKEEANRERKMIFKLDSYSYMLIVLLYHFQVFSKHQ